VATQHPIEIILARQWAESMAHPMWITDADGNLLFYNEAAEGILGVRFDEAGEMPASELAERFVTTNLDGSPLPADRLPLVETLTGWRPSHGSLRIQAFDGRWRSIHVTSIPLVAEGDRRLGALAIFWELDG
jgi:PAS domain-containing protein